MAKHMKDNGVTGKDMAMESCMIQDTVLLMKVILALDRDMAKVKLRGKMDINMKENFFKILVMVKVFKFLKVQVHIRANFNTPKNTVTGYIRAKIRLTRVIIKMTKDMVLAYLGVWVITTRDNSKKMFIQDMGNITVKTMSTLEQFMQVGLNLD